MKKKHYRLNDIFRFLRTELYCPVTESEELDLEDVEQKNLHFKNSALSWRGKVDIAENVALAYGYQGKDWIKRISTKGLNEFKETFEILRNQAFAPRNGSIIFRNNEKNIADTLFIIQHQVDTVFVDKKDIKANRIH